MINYDIDKAYVSPYDRFLYEFDVNHAKSESQLKEIKKHQRIAALRDDAQLNPNQQKIWDQF